MSDKKIFFYSFYATLLLIFTVVTLAYVAFLGPLQSQNDPAQAAVGPKDKLSDTTILLCVRENERSLPRNFALINISPTRGQIAICNLPDQLQVSFGSRDDKLAQCYGYAGILQVSQSLAQSGIKSDFYLDITVGGLSEILNFYGTFSFEMPQSIYHYDENGLLSFKLNAGSCTVGGAQLAGILNYNTLQGDAQTTLWLNLCKAATQKFLTDHNVQTFPQDFAKNTPHFSSNITSLDAQQLQKKLAAVLAVSPVSIVCPQVFEPDDLPLILEDYF